MPRFALILLSALLLLTLTPTSALPHVPEARRPAVAPLDERPFGINSHIASRYPDASSMSVPAQIVAQSRAGWAREDFQWFRIEPQRNQFDWFFTDQMVVELRRHNINILGVLGPSVGWATSFPADQPSNVSFYAPDPQAFARYAGVVAKRYRGIVNYWEIWNEPDNDLFWKPKPDPVAYAQLLKLAAAEIRKANPEAKILIGGMNAFDMSFIRTVHAHGAWQSFDIINLHPYVDPLEPESGNIVASTDSMRALALEYGQKPIWVTEMGWSSGPGDRDKIGVTDEQEQASYLTRAMVLLWLAGVERIFWYNLKDDVGNPYGLVALGEGRLDYRRLKPAFFAFRTLNRTLGGASLVEMRDLFSRMQVTSFEATDSWLPNDPTYGAMSYSNELVHSGAQSLKINYRFPSGGNDYLVLTPGHRPQLPSSARLVGLWVYGDGSAQGIKVWMQDATGAVVQYPIGSVGPRGWHFISAPLSDTVPPWDRVSGGDGRVTFPLRFFALVIDDAPDSFQGSGTIFIDDLTALSGLEAYDLRLRRGNEAIDMLWSPNGTTASIRTNALSSTIIDRDGRSWQQAADGDRLRFTLGPAPIYVQHIRP